MICTGFQPSRTANRTCLEDVVQCCAVVQHWGEQAFEHSSSIASEQTSVVPLPPGKGKFSQLVPRVALLMHNLKKDNWKRQRLFAKACVSLVQHDKKRLAALQIIAQMLHNERLIHVKPGHVKATSLSQLSKSPFAITLHNEEWMYRQEQWLMPQHARSLFSWETWKVRGVNSHCWVEVQIYHPWYLARSPVFDWWTNPQGWAEDGDEGLPLCALLCAFFF